MTKQNNIFTKAWFEQLESKLREMGTDSDYKSFDEIKANIKNRPILPPDEFAATVIYVIMASGFRQKTAKEYHRRIMEKLAQNPSYDDLLEIFNNDKKIDSIMHVWNNRNEFCTEYYKCASMKDKLAYLKTLPHIGNITVGHLARNLGEDTVKYDIWIQRLGALYSQNTALYQKVNNANLQPEIKQACEDMFEHIVRETGLPRGYIDVVLFRSCQNGLIDVKIK